MVTMLLVSLFFSNTSPTPINIKREGMTGWQNWQDKEPASMMKSRQIARLSPFFVPSHGEVRQASRSSVSLTSEEESHILSPPSAKDILGDGLNALSRTGSAKLGDRFLFF